MPREAITIRGTVRRKDGEEFAAPDADEILRYRLECAVCDLSDLYELVWEGTVAFAPEKGR
jgi:hypothetical protein